MNRRWFLSLAIGALGGCQTGTDTTDGSKPHPSFIISDATHSNGNPNFFWLPPMVPDPSGSPTWKATQFNPNLQPTIYVCLLYEGTRQPVAGDQCAASGYTQNFPWNGTDPNLGVVLNLTAQSYQANWKVATNANDAFYRIFALLGPYGQAGTFQLGYADVEAVLSGSQLAALVNVNTGLDVTLKDGRTLPIQFRIQNGATCTATPCAAATVSLATGGTVKTTSPINGAPVGVSIPAQTPTSPAITFTTQPCSYGNRLQLQGTPIDLPVFGSCITLISSPQLISVLPNAATVFVCDYPPNVASLSVQQQDFVALHAAHNDWVSPAPFAEALPEAAVNCASLVQAPEQGLKAVFASLWHGKWKEAGHELLSWVGPKPLEARMRMRRIHLGGGGKTGLQSDFQFALPAKMAVSAGDGVSVPPGTTITATALVTDLFGIPVQGAKVHFAVTGGGGSIAAPTALSDATGLASVQWTLGAVAGTNTLKATGFGIASPGTHGPRATFDPFMPTYRVWGDLSDQAYPGVTLQTGSLMFTATGVLSPVDIFGFGASGYTYVVGVHFDGVTTRVGSGDQGTVAAPANWYSTTFVPDIAWTTNGQAGFGTLGGCAINTATTVANSWGVFTDILVRKSFTTPYAGTLTLTLYIDNDAQVYLDNVNVTSQGVGTTGYNSTSGWWEHDGCADGGAPVFTLPGITAGSHLLAIRGHDYGGSTFLDVKAHLAP